MATVVDNLIIRLIGNATSFQKMLKDVTKDANSAAAKVNRAGQKIERVGKSLNKVGKNLSLKVTAPLAIVGGLAVREFSKFDKAMTESTSIMKATTDQVDQMRQKALELSSSGALLQAPEELAKSYFFLASAGKNAEQSMALLPAVSKFATAGAFDMALATDLLTDAQSALGLTSENVAKDTLNLVKVGDVLVKANTLANASVQQFSEALTNQAGPALKGTNKTIEEGVAILAAYADQGIKGNVAGSMLSRVLLLMKKSALDNSKAHDQLGFSVFDANGKMRNMADIIQNLEQITGGMSDEMKAATLAQLGFEARVQQAIMPLLGASEAVRGYQDELENAGGTTDEVANKQMKSFSNKMKVVINQIKATAVTVGEDLAPALESLGNGLAAVSGWFKSLNPSVRKIVVTLLATAAAIGPLLLAFGFLATGISKLFLPLTLLVGKWGVLTAAVKLHVAALWSAQGAMMAMKAAGVALALVAIVLIAKKIYEANSAVKAFNASMKEGIALQNKLLKRHGKKTAGIIQEASEMQDPAERSKFLKEELQRAQKDVQGKASSVRGAQQRVEQLDTVWAGLVGDKVLAEARQEVSDQKAQLEANRNKVEAIRDALKESRKEETKAASDKGKTIADKAQKAMEGILEGEEKARKAAEQKKTAKDKTEELVAGIRGVGAGSAEAAAKLAAFKSINAPIPVDQKKPVTKEESLLTTIVDVLRSIFEQGEEDTGVDVKLSEGLA